ncbi:MAG: DNA recombination protein RmuC [Candidatus Pacebacteria bacterium]|nr:DNA recombination protein RmuC [Candidatus Paceibacterota bacterium]
MNNFLFIIILFLVFLGGVVITFFWLSKKKPKEQPDALLMLQEQLNTINKTLDSKLSESQKRIESQFNQSTKIIRDVTERLTKLDETNKQVIGFAEQLQSLENILKNPKQRGILGEYYLEELLKNVFPPNNYQMQYEFKDGIIVDAVIFLPENKLIPIDSKFSLENYNKIIKEKDPVQKEKLEKIFVQDLKNRIDETAKYIKPDEGTLDFAFMFIPAEAVYYDLLINEVGAVKSNTRNLIEYSQKEKHVIVVSPTTFYAYLQTILQGLRAMQIEKSAKEIRKRVEMLGRHLSVYEEYMQKLGNHLGTTVNSYNLAYKEFGKVDKDVIKITEEKSKIKIKQLEKPNQEK